MTQQNEVVYQPQKIEPYWRKKWEEAKAYEAPYLPEGKTKFYCLDMFPYPSGKGLHVGHWRGYVLSDVICRYRLGKGEVVLHPMGWDAFGLPAENDAIKKGMHPRVNTQKNIDNMRRQLKEIGAVYDWSRELATTDPDYYHWTQWIFLKMYKRGLAYRNNIPINWCPHCKCGLANEEVVAGRCERCGTETTKKDRQQWMMRITDYAERLLNDLDDLDWPEKVKLMQRNWIGRSEGAEVEFKVIGADNLEHPLTVFTTRPDTLWGATYVVMAPEHPLVLKTAAKEKRKDVEVYIEKTRKESDQERTVIDREKTGVATGAYAINPVNGQKIPVWISDYVLMGYGTGAIMAVPAHDERDFEFATKFNLPIIEVIHNEQAVRNDNGTLKQAYVGEGKMINSADFNGQPSIEGKRKVTKWLEEKSLAKFAVNYRLRDWVFSRQRYWGEPIPIIHCEKCGEVSVPEQDLPVLLPDVESYQVTGTGDSPLAAIKEWVNVPCPKCKGPAKRETDTMPQWAGSCWYFLRYASPKYDQGPFDPEAVKEWLPVDMYVGGVEHAILHLLYARFFVKVLFDEGLVKFNEPFKRLFNQGMICRRSFRCDCCRTWLAEETVIEKDKCPTCKKELLITLDKMSKSKSNDVPPDALVEKYGTDSVRLYELFVGPPEVDAEWTTNGIEGCSRFLKRYFAWVNHTVSLAGKDNDEVARLRHTLIKTITERIEGLRFNTAIAAFMEFMNAVDKVDPKEISLDTLKAVTICLAPFAPHLADELWHNALKQEGFVFEAGWPTWTEELTQKLEIEVPIQVNGKLRSKLVVQPETAKEELEKMALADETVQKYLAGKDIKKVIVVPKRLVNIVVA
ncbi:MAG: leucine--tRNA ligase [Pseudomonadota bacterium]